MACSLVAKCEGCARGHIKKALELGATKQEISDAIVVAVGIGAAAWWTCPTRLRSTWIFTISNRAGRKSPPERGGVKAPEERTS